ncbi:MAG: PspC domain-containing protein [Rikenellaceae bacterium]|nr:PspC domain-containing protein [Rikenellaceae bacterium]MDE7134362.1 PspC domain-containing protein [Rikenellaceae bacterium]MDE7356056.1 PspC domain-containing protein [Rikenellaceae bacterium]
MKRTTTVNISGTAFCIEEEAYCQLNGYLMEITERLSNQPDAAEIIEDIESRISELLREYGAGTIRVVTTPMIDRVKSTLGSPEVFADNDYDKSRENKKMENKKLFRDTRHKVLGGVCSGLGLYFNIDPVIIRVVMLILVICFGTGIFAYLIMWIIMPRPKTEEDFKIMGNMNKQD